MEIRAIYKQTTIKNGCAVLQMEVLQSAENFNEVIKLSGKTVVLDISDEQPEIPFEELDYEDSEPIPFEQQPEVDFDHETGEIIDEGRMLNDGTPMLEEGEE